MTGQALVMGLVVLFMGTLTLFYLFSSGQVSADKQRVTNAADAAAYSSALWRARVLNYDAYANRAMIANEVAIAQTLTLLSETQYLKDFAFCLDKRPGDRNRYCTALISYITMFIPYLNQTLAAVGDTLDGYQNLLASTVPFEVTNRSLVANTALSLSQSLLDASAQFLAVQSTIATQVTQANDGNFTVKVLPDNFVGLFGGGFTKQYKGADRARLANVVRVALDPYSRDRPSLLLGHDLTVIPDVCVAGLIYRKRGGTTLDSALDRWEAADVASEWSYYLGSTGCDKKEEPLAWGDSQASGGTSNQDTGHVHDNPKTLSWARAATLPARGYVGIQNFEDLNYNSLTSNDPAVQNPTHRLVVVVRMGAGNLRTANTLNMGVGRLRMTESTNQNRIASVAAAEVYFKRESNPQSGQQRSDGKTEYPSLFNPYWQARLAEPTLAQRTAATLLP
jgi:hypothetical protein